MKLWYIRKNTDLDYEARRIKEECEALDIVFDVVVPEEVDILVNRTDRKSIRLRNQSTSLPDIVLPRTGSGTGYFTLAVLRQLEHLGVPIVNNPNAIELVKDKLYSLLILPGCAYAVPIGRAVLFRSR